MLSWPLFFYEEALEWLSDEWNRPSRTDHYLMRVATEVRRSYVKRPRSVKAEHFRIRFEQRNENAQRKGVTMEDATDLSKQVWQQRLGNGAVRVVRAGEDPNLVEPVRL